MSDSYFILFYLFICITNITDAWDLRDQIRWYHVIADVLLPPACCIYSVMKKKKKVLIKLLSFWFFKHELQAALQWGNLELVSEPEPRILLCDFSLHCVVMTSAK